jgi:hypothetical protein
MKKELEKLTKEQLLELVEHFEHYPSVTEEDDKAYILTYLEDEACQISEEQILKYLLKTIAGYIKAGNHDDALREKEAEQGTKTYDAFRGFVKTHFKASVENLFKNDKLKEKDKIEQINKWWNEFKKQTSNKK